MSTTPPESTPSGGTSGPGSPGSQYGYLPGSGNAFASLPIPGNAEIVVYLAVELLFAIITLASDRVDAPLFMTATMWLTAAYILSRGIAKASRVLEQ
jgi:hypothetical protein